MYIQSFKSAVPPVMGVLKCCVSILYLAFLVLSGSITVDVVFFTHDNLANLLTSTHFSVPHVLRSDDCIQTRCFCHVTFLRISSYTVPSTDKDRSPW